MFVPTATRQAPLANSQQFKAEENQVFTKDEEQKEAKPENENPPRRYASFEGRIIYC